MAKTAQAGDTEIAVQDDIDFKPDEELMVAATSTPHKHFNGNVMHGAPPVEFETERVFVESVSMDRRTVTTLDP